LINNKYIGIIFLGFTGDADREYDGLSTLINKVDKFIPVHVYEYWRMESAFRYHQLYDKEKKPIIFGHSRGANAGIDFAKLYYDHYSQPCALVAAIDAIPNSTIGNLLSLFGLRTNIVLSSLCSKRVLNFYQRHKNILKPDTWPQGRILVTDRGDRYKVNQLIAGATHTDIDANEYVHKMILKQVKGISQSTHLFG